MTPTAIPVNSLARHFAPLHVTLASAAREVIESGYYVLGPGVGAFEAEFAAYCGVDHCIGVANGTDALEIALKACGVHPGDRVVVVANAAMYGTSAVLACAATPVFVDVDPATHAMDPAALQQVLDGDVTPQAVIVTHLYGRLAAIEAIAAACAVAGVPLIEDCAQAHGARLADGRKAGSFGDAASFSFYPTKNLGALGDGGAVVTTDAEIGARARMLRQYGWTAKYSNGLAGGRNSRLDELQARLLSLMLPHLDQWNATRRAIANRYSRGIRNPRIDVALESGDDCVAHLYVVRTGERAALQAHLAAAGIQTDVHYPIPDHRQACHAGAFDGVHLPVTEAGAAQVLTLPCFPEMSETEVQAVIDACNRF